MIQSCFNKIFNFKPFSFPKNIFRSYHLSLYRSLPISKKVNGKNFIILDLLSFQIDNSFKVNMKVVQVPVLSDNYSYLLIDEENRVCAAIDPAEPKKYYFLFVLGFNYSLILLGSLRLLRMKVLQSLMS